MTRSTRAAGRRSAPRANRSRQPAQRAHRSRSVSKAIGLTLVSALIPGLGFVLGGRKKLGAFVITLYVGLLLIAAYVGLTQRDALIALAVNPSRLLLTTGGVLVVGLLWICIVVSSHKLLRPISLTSVGRFAGSAFVGLLCFGIAVPTTFAAQTVMAQRDLIGGVFKSEKDSKSATRPKLDEKDPWAKKPRLNLVLLGADDGAGREGTRTDTVIVASIDTKTGDTTLISLSRNWMRMPFPEDSPLHAKFPDGYYDPSGPAEQPEYYLDSMYDNIPKKYPGILGATDNEGADVLKLSAGAALGLDIDYYMQINLKGFEQIIDALGGITVNINYPVPIGGDYGDGPGSNTARKPSSYLQPGPNQKLNGHDALWFARGRYGLSDPSRQERQRCTIHGLVTSATPAALATSYSQIVAVSKDLLRTDIPGGIVPDFVDLGLKVKNANVTNLDLDKAKNFPTGQHPNYQAMQELVQKAIQPKTTPVASTPSSKPSTSTTKKPGTKPTTAKPPVGQPQNLSDACAYDPTQTGTN